MNKIIITFIYTMIVSGCFTTIAIAQPPQSIQVANNIQSNNDSQQARTNNQDNLTKILIIAGLVAGVGTVGWYLSRYRSSTASAIPSHRHRALIDRVNPKLRRQLLRLINDPKTANRLLEGVQKHNGDRSPDWLAEKAIYDLTAECGQRRHRRFTAV